MEKISYKEELRKVKIINVFCDKCNKEIIELDNYNGFKSNLNCSIGEWFPYDGGYFSGIKYKLDLCEDCSGELFKNILPGLGYNIIASEE